MNQSGDKVVVWGGGGVNPPAPTSFYSRLLEIHTFKDDVNGISSISDVYLIPLTDWEREISAF
jgi:hypothetical protein